MTKILARAASASALIWAVAGCVLPPAGGYQTGSYQTGTYYQSPQTAYVAPDAGYVSPQAGFVTQPTDPYPEQYVYTDGQPYAVVAGQQFGVLFDPGLGWGYYDGYHRWHGAPPRWRDDFDRRYPGGRGFAPGLRGGPEFHRDDGFRREQGFPGAQGFHRENGFRREESFQGRPGGPPPGFARPEGQPRAERFSAPGQPPQQAGRPPGPPPAAHMNAPGPPPQRAEPARVEPTRAMRAGCGTPSQPHC